MSSAAEILEALRASFKQERIPFGGASVLVREMSAGRRDAYEQSMVSVDASGQRTVSLINYKARLLAQCIVDETTGDSLFSEDELASVPGSAINLAFEVAQRLNGLGIEPAVAEKN